MCLWLTVTRISQVRRKDDPVQEGVSRRDGRIPVGAEPLGKRGCVDPRRPYQAGHDGHRERSRERSHAPRLRSGCSLVTRRRVID